MQCQRRTDTSFACPVVGRRELEKSQQGHRERIQNIRSAIDTRAPAAQPHLTLYGRDYVSKKKATTEAAFSDLKMIQSIARTMTRRSEIPARMGPVSLNAGQRKQEIFRVMRENHRLLDRLETGEPVINARSALQDHDWKRRYVINSSHSMRMAGEYDGEIGAIHSEDKAKTMDMQRSCQMRLSRRAMNTVSLPALPAASPPQQKKKPSSSQQGGRGRPNGGPLATSSSSTGFGAVSAPTQQPPSAVVVYDDDEYPLQNQHTSSRDKSKLSSPTAPVVNAASPGAEDMLASTPASPAAEAERDEAANASNHASQSAYENTFEGETRLDKGSAVEAERDSAATVSHNASQSAYENTFEGETRLDRSSTTEAERDAAANDGQPANQTQLDRECSGFEPDSVNSPPAASTSQGEATSSGRPFNDPASPASVPDSLAAPAAETPAPAPAPAAEDEASPPVSPGSPGSPSSPAVGLGGASPSKTLGDTSAYDDEDFDDPSMTASKFMQSNASAADVAAARKDVASRGSEGFEESFLDGTKEKPDESMDDSFEDT